jgi:acetyl-CoA decarbonylase/synthase, CODH/ACS complex subunit delta
VAFEVPKQLYSGKIREITLGQGNGAVKIGGEDSYPFHLFEGSMPNPPKIAMEVWDCDPSDEWPEAALEPFKDVISAPDSWAKKCVEKYGADMIVLQLKSTDPNGMDGSAEEAAETVKKVLDVIDVPLVVWGTANNQKDEEVLKKISEACEGSNLALAPVEEGNHKGVGASALGYNHTVVASSPIDVNLAKQLNVLLGNLGVQSDKMLIDPTTGGLGYGLEYSYSVMERIRMAALTQEDDKLQMAMISNIGNEIWKCKEAGQPIEEGPALGDPEKRGILMEAVAAASYMMAGSDVVILRHPESVRLVRSFVELMIKGGMATDIGGIAKRLESKEIDLVSVSPEPDLAIANGETQTEKKAGERKTEQKISAPENKRIESQPKPEEAAKETPKPEEKKHETTAVLKPEKEIVAPNPEQEEALEAVKKTEKETEERAEGEEEAREKTEAQAKTKAETKKRQANKAKVKTKAKKIKKTAADTQPSLVDKLMQDIDRIHRRV